MAIKTGTITIRGIQAIECDTDPSIGGLYASVGSFASATDGSGIFYKSASLDTSWDKVVTPSVTITLTNKRITPRVTTIVTSSTPTINTNNCDAVTITALASDITSMTTNLSGSPNNFDKLIIRFKDNGTARVIAWGASFANYGGVLPLTTVVGKTINVALQWDSVALVWCCLASVTQP